MSAEPKFDAIEEVVKSVRAALNDEGYGYITDEHRIEVFADPVLANVWAAKVVAPWDEMHFLVHFSEPEGERVEECEFTCWPPRSLR